MEANFMVPAGSVISLLLMGNIWFIRRLVLEIDDLKKVVNLKLPVQQNEIKNMSDKINSFEKKIMEISHDVKDFGRLRERVAVIEALTTKRTKRTADNTI